MRGRLGRGVTETDLTLTQSLSQSPHHAAAFTFNIDGLVAYSVITAVFQPRPRPQPLLIKHLHLCPSPPLCLFASTLVDWCFLLFFWRFTQITSTLFPTGGVANSRRNNVESQRPVPPRRPRQAITARAQEGPGIKPTERLARWPYITITRPVPRRTGSTTEGAATSGGSRRRDVRQHTAQDTETLIHPPLPSSPDSLTHAQVHRRIGS